MYYMRAPEDWPLPLGPLPPHRLGDRRDGHSPLEQAALARTEACIGALHAVDLVRICLWPTLLPELARAHGRAPSTLHNTLTFANGRPNRPSRLLLARTLGLSVPDIDYAIETPRGAIPPGESVPGARDGSGALDKLTLKRMRENLAAFGPGVVLQMIIWPFSEAELADAVGAEREHLYQAVSALRGPFRAVRERVAGFMEVEAEVLDHLLDAARLEPVRIGGAV